MKKGLLFLIIGLFLSTFTFAQLVSETFETQPTVTSGTHPSVTISGWLNHATVGTRTWLARQYGDPVNRYAQATAYNSTDASNVYWLVAPGVNMNLSTGESLSFDYNSGYDNGFALAVLYSNNFDGTTGGIATATWTDITSSFTIPAGPTDTYGTIAAAGSLNVSAYTGTVYFAFRYTGAATGTTTTVQVDNIVLSGVVGIDEVNLFETAVYPNPVSDILTISEASNITVASITGQIVIKANNTTSVDMSNLTKGMYIVTIENREGVRSEKIFKN
jgi:hypothetical protein